MIINLIGCIVDWGVEYVFVKEWMWICFEFFDLFKVYKWVIWWVVVNFFGYIVKVIGF